MRNFHPAIDELHEWIEKNKPELHARIVGMSPIQALRQLNAETGLSVSPNSLMQVGAAQFLAALKARASSKNL